MRQMTANGVPMACVDLGQGPAILLVHGFPLDHSMWDRQVDSLAAGHRVIAPDLRGFGKNPPTGAAPDSIQPHSVIGDRSKDPVHDMELFADDLNALLDALEVREPVVFCGLSMGGYIGWQFVRKYRRRLRGLICCDTRAVADAPAMIATRMAIIEHVQVHGTAWLANESLPKLFGPRCATEQPETLAKMREVVLHNSPAGICAALRGMAARPDCTSLLATIDLPTLVLVGEHDSISTPGEMLAIADAIADAKCVVIENAGHMAPLEQPEQANAALLDFLARIEAGS